MVTRRSDPRTAGAGGGMRVGPMTGAARVGAVRSRLGFGNGLATLPPEIRALYLLLALEVGFLVWQRQAFRAAHGG